MTKFDLTTKFRGYRNKEDVTNLGRGYLIPGSQNVLLNEGERCAVRAGYTLFGAANPALATCNGSYDWQNRLGAERHVRSFDVAGTSTLEFLFGSTWYTLVTGATIENFNFDTFWDTTEFNRQLLFVNGASQINEWTGGIVQISANTAITLTKSGTTTWAEEGFYQAGTRQVTIVGLGTFAYTGGENTTTLTGLVGLPAIPVGTVAFQTVRVTANPGGAGQLPTAFDNDLIAVFRNQVYIASKQSNFVYVSKVDDYTDFSFTSPVRLVGEGDLLSVRGTVVGFIPQDNELYVTSANDNWFRFQYQLSADLTSESILAKQLKTNPLEGALSQEAIAKIKNSIIYISREKAVNELGQIENILTPQVKNISDPIKIDFETLNFNRASLIYFQYNVFFALPAEGKVLIWNMAEQWWEAPQILPIARFSIINGELYGHSSAVVETYKLFDGVNDNGAPIDATAMFSYDQFGLPANLKNFNEYYIEGYISSNTTLTASVSYEVAGCGSEADFIVKGADKQIVCLNSGDRSLGKKSLGKFSLARLTTALSGKNNLPPKFRVIKTMTQTDFYECAVAFSSNGDDQRWEILRFGPAVMQSTAENTYIKQ